MIQNSAAARGYRSHRASNLCGRHALNSKKFLAHTLYPKRGIRVYHNVFGAIIFKKREHYIPKLAPELHFQPVVLFIANYG
jgi:hypothetical protein